MRSVVQKHTAIALPTLALAGAALLMLPLGSGCGTTLAPALVENGSTLRGDVDGDGAVTQADLDLLTAAFGLEDGDPDFPPEADLTGDGIIGLDDIQVLIQILDSAGS
jgi:hypothetical protein